MGSKLGNSDCTILVCELEFNQEQTLLTEIHYKIHRELFLGKQQQQNILIFLPVWELNQKYFSF